MRADQLRRVPDGVTTKEAALAEPFGVALHAVSRAGDLAGRSVLVNGAGPIGALCVAAARSAGAAHVVAARMGADATVNPGAGEALPQDVDVTLEASGAPAALGNVLLATRRGGVVVQVGNLPGSAVEVSLGQVVTREIDLRGSYRFVDEMSEALRLMAQGVDLAPVMTHEFALAQAVEAFRVAADRSTGSSKVMLDLRA